MPAHGLLAIARKHRWAPADRLRHLVNGVDLAHYDPEAAPEPHPAVGRRACVVAVAPLRPEKRLDRLIALFARAAPEGDVRLLLCGAGPCEADLRQQAARTGLGKRIVFAGQIDDVRTAFGPESVFALTSATEQMPNALLQAMAMARPVVAFDAGDVARMLPASDPGQVLAQDDSAGFADALVRLLGSHELRARLGRENRARAEQAYDMNAMVAAYDRLYRTALEGAR